MTILSPAEKEFLDVFLHEATTSPFFSGPASKALLTIGVGYHDISYISWAYDREVPRTSWEWGHAAAVAPPLPWANRESALPPTGKSSASGNRGMHELLQDDQPSKVGHVPWPGHRLGKTRPTAWVKITGCAKPQWGALDDEISGEACLPFRPVGACDCLRP